MAQNLIVNADDFGFSVGVTDGIVQAHQAGILTSTTLMTTMPDAHRAVELARRNHGLGVGIHLSLTQGTPLAGMDGPLFSPRGVFPPGVAKLIWRLTRDKSILRQVRREWESQINFAVSRGLQPTHLDSHKHIHHWPALGEIAIDLARQFNIRHIRCARERTIPGVSRPAIGYRVVSRMAHALALRINQAGLTTTNWFFGLAATGRFSADVWRLLLTHLPPGTGEVMVHPGRPNGLNRSVTRLLAERQLELDGLCDPAIKVLAASNSICLIHYGQLDSVLVEQAPG